MQHSCFDTQGAEAPDKALTHMGGEAAMGSTTEGLLLTRCQCG